MGGQYWCKEDCGTRTTMAPEVIDCAYSEYGYVPKFADVWSLGVTVLALLAPRTPDEHGCDEHGYYAWSSAAWHWGYANWEDEAYGQYVTLQRAMTPGGPTAIAKLLQTSDEHDFMPQQLPAAVLVALDRMLRIDPYARISAPEAVSLLAEPLF